MTCSWDEKQERVMPVKNLYSILVVADPAATAKSSIAWPTFWWSRCVRWSPVLRVGTTSGLVANS